MELFAFLLRILDISFPIFGSSIADLTFMMLLNPSSEIQGQYYQLPRKIALTLTETENNKIESTRTHKNRLLFSTMFSQQEYTGF
jgi:hypothetical protein